jgi:hypothetical protein
MPIPFLAAMLLGVGSLILSYLLMPKPKQPKPLTVDDLKEPTAEAGRPIPVLQGSSDIKGLNVLSYHDKSIRNRTEGSGGKK